mmetsp:Transcript_12740/g.45771  ORF Transcript_12740/g.45771 Transcript_12740/m.45771 type:complete len:204 (+) Transcript_12740:599-1210(+)
MNFSSPFAALFTLEVLSPEVSLSKKLTFPTFPFPFAFQTVPTVPAVETGYDSLNPDAQRSIYSNMSSSRPRKCPQQITKSTSRCSKPLSTWFDCSTRGSNSMSYLLLLNLLVCDTFSAAPRMQAESVTSVSPSTCGTEDEEPHSPIIETIRSTAAPLLTPMGRTSTDLAPWMTSTAALDIGPVHKCCSRSFACCLPKSGSAYL